MRGRDDAPNVGVPAHAEMNALFEEEHVSE
jgi:hypothetical protein